MLQTQLFPAEKKNRYDAFDASHLLLPEDEPLSNKIIESYRELAYSVVEQALNDLLSEDEVDRRNAVDFCTSNDRSNREVRLMWLGWLQMEEAVLAKAARKRLGWLSSTATV